MYNIDDFIDSCESMKIVDLYVDIPSSICEYIGSSIATEGFGNKGTGEKKGIIQRIVGWIRSIIDKFKKWWNAFRAKHKSKKKMRQEFKDEKELYDSKIAELNKQIADLTRQVSDVNNYNETLKNDYKNLSQQNRDAMQRYNNSMQTNKSLLDENEDLQRQNTQYASDNSQLKAKLEELQKEKEYINNAYDRLRKYGLAAKLEDIVNGTTDIIDAFSHMERIMSNIIKSNSKYDIRTEREENQKNHDFDSYDSEKNQEILIQLENGIDKVGKYIEELTGYPNSVNSAIAKSFLRNAISLRTGQLETTFPKFVANRVVPSMNQIAEELHDRPDLSGADTRFITSFITMCQRIIELNRRLLTME